MVLLSRAGDNFDEAIEVFGVNFGLVASVLTPSEKVFRWSYRAVGDETMTFRSAQVFANNVTALGPSNEFVVCWGRAGEVSFERGRTVTEMPLKVPYFVSNQGLPLITRGVDSDLNLIHISEEFVRDVAKGLHDVRFVNFEMGPPKSAQALLSWKRVVSLVGTVVLDPSMPTSSILRQEMSRMLAAAMLETFTYQSICRLPGPAGIEPVSVRAAEDFIHYNAHLPISTVDIARAVNLSVRALQYALRRYRHTTPTGLLQSVRLEHVHTELTASDIATGSVAAIAREWGFLHLGRFASVYRVRFGESPRQTLRR